MGVTFSGFAIGRFFLRLSFPAPTIGMQYSTVDISDAESIGGGWFAVEQGIIRQGWVLAPLLFNIVFAAFVNMAYTRFKADKDIMDTLVHPRKRTGAGWRGEQPTESLPPGNFAMGHVVR